MAITRTNFVDDDGSGTTGTVWDNAEKHRLYDQIDGIAGGTWVDIPYNAADFSASGSGTWAVPSFTTFAYMQNGKTIYIAFYTTAASITGTPISLDIRLTGSTVARAMTTPFNYFNGTVGVGWANPTGTSLKLYKDILGTAWAAGGCYVTGVFIINVV